MTGQVHRNWKEWADEYGAAYRALDDAKVQAQAETELKHLRTELDAALRTDPLCLGVRTEADLAAAVREAAGAACSADALAALQKRLARRFPRLLGVMDGTAEPKPQPLLWGAGVKGAVLSRGEIAVLSGAGGRGKSTLALQWALAAALADAADRSHGESGGIGVRAGRTAILSWEDSVRRVADRAAAALSLSSLRQLSRNLPPSLTASDAVNERIRIAEVRGWPLFGVGDGSHSLTRPDRLEGWKPTWAQIAEHRADIVILDPAMSSYLADPHSVPFVRLFLDSLFTEAQSLGCGVLLIAHSTKAARRSRDADATGTVAGSAAWTDAARGVLSLDCPPTPTAKESDNAMRQRLGLRHLTCEKANYSRLFTHNLAEKFDSENRFLGFENVSDSGTIQVDTNEHRVSRII